MLEALANALPVNVTTAPPVEDTLAAVEKRLEELAGSTDVILSTGGASKGDADHLRTALLSLGQCHLWQLAIKPGRPMMMGQIGQVPVFGLPGNPVAAFVCWCLYVYPALLRLAGAKWRIAQTFNVPAHFETPSKKPDRRVFYRGWFEADGDTIKVKKFERDGSGLISGLQAAQCLIEIPEDVTKIRPGEPVSVIPLSQFGILP